MPSPRHAPARATDQSASNVRSHCLDAALKVCSTPAQGRWGMSPGGNVRLRRSASGCRHRWQGQSTIIDRPPNLLGRSVEAGPSRIRRWRQPRRVCHDPLDRGATEEPVMVENRFVAGQSRQPQLASMLDPVSLGSGAANEPGLASHGLRSAGHNRERGEGHQVEGDLETPGLLLIDSRSQDSGKASPCADVPRTKARSSPAGGGSVYQRGLLFGPSGGPSMASSECHQGAR